MAYRPDEYVVFDKSCTPTGAVEASCQARGIGIGASGSGTARFVPQVFAPFAELGLRLSTHSMDEQLAKLEAGELDLGAMVIDTVGERSKMPASAQHRTPEVRAQLEAIIDQLVTLSDRCRRYSLSILDPMGQELPIATRKRS